MKRKQAHMIGRQKMEVNFDSVSPGVGVQNTIADLYYEELLPELNTLFNELAGDQFLISADHIEIDCGLLSADHWKDELVEQTLKKIKLELRLLGKREIGPVTVQRELQKEILYFLEYGFLPWNSSVESMEVFQKMEPDKLFIEKLKELLFSKPASVERLVYQFPDLPKEKLIRLLAVFKDKIDFFIKERTPFLKKDPEAVRLILEMISTPEIDLPASAELEKVTRDANVESRPAKLDKVPDLEQEGIYIENAGLVLLHPFLPELFNRLGLWRDKQWVEEKAQHDAVYVLGYLSTGDIEHPEFDLILNKIMCGLQPAEVLLPCSELSEAVRSECDELLISVVGHWSQLKNTSIAALRETFLQRDGKLTRTDHGWLIHIERKGVDVLLGSLPWGIGTIKLPWTKDKLFVEW